jgi:hypothetical protein
MHINQSLPRPISGPITLIPFKRQQKVFYKAIGVNYPKNKSKEKNKTGIAKHILKP